MMTQLFSHVPFECLIFFIDDILLSSKTFEDHLKRLEYIFNKLSWANLKISPGKTNLFRKEITFVGVTLGKNGISICEDRVIAVKNLKSPENLKSLQQVIGIFNYNRAFIKNFSILINPMYKLLRKGVKFEWTTECQNSFDSLIEAIINSPVLAIPDTRDVLSSYQVHVDASKLGFGATLSQLIDGERKTIAYFSKAVPSHQSHFGATKLEFLALYNALKHWRLYLEGAKKVVIKTDCSSLLRLDHIFARDNAYFQRRLAELSGFNLEIHHIEGKRNIQSDFLSRYPFNKSTKNVGVQTTEVNSVQLQVYNLQNNHAITIDEIKKEQRKDYSIRQVIDWFENKNRPEKLEVNNTPMDLHNYWRNFKLFTVEPENGILCRKWASDKILSEYRNLIVVPTSIIPRVLYNYHDSMNNCHSGIEISLDSCRQTYYWYHQEDEFKQYISACLTCSTRKQPKAYLRAPLKNIVHTDFNQCIAIDHLVPDNRTTKSGHTALLTIVDMFSNYTVCIQVKSQSTNETIKVIIEHWVLKYGLPGACLHDNHANFSSVLFATTLKIFGIHNKHTTIYKSSSNGIAEAQNKRINNAMRVSLNNEQHKDWDIWIKYV